MGGAGEEQAEKPSYLRVQQALEQVEAKRLLGPTTTGWVAISQTNSSKKKCNKPAQARTSWGAGYGQAAKPPWWAARGKAHHAYG